MPLAVKINVALREQNCQKIGSERVKLIFTDISILQSEFPSEFKTEFYLQVPF